jgi:predicted phosphoribosyltransferase
VVTGGEVARELDVPLEVLIVRKIGAPANPELAIGAVAETGSVVLNRDIMAEAGLSEDMLLPQIEQQKEEITRRVSLYRAGTGTPDLAGRMVILIDDGTATGASVKAAITALKNGKIARLVVALPVGPPETIQGLRRMADEVVCLETPDPFLSVGGHYRDFTQVSDGEVVKILRDPALKAAGSSRARRLPGPEDRSSSGEEDEMPEGVIS